MATDLVVVGLGYVGLPLAARASEAGLSTIGIDVRPDLVAALNVGRSHITDLADDVVVDMLVRGFHATTDPAVIAEADTVVLCVPTGLTPEGRPDLDAVRSATRAVAEHLRPGTLVALESTSYPGTTEEIVRPILERGSGLVAGEDFHLVFSPERIDPGNTEHTVRSTPKIISGVTPLCAKHGVAFYGRFVDSLVVARGTREAEMAKLLENTYRYVNIALVNEIALYCDRTGIDVWDVLHCAATKPFGFAPFSPGAGVGGHCIPVDPLYLQSKANSEGFSFATLVSAQEVNERMPIHVADRAEKVLREAGHRIVDARVLLLGVAYKPNVTDTRESPAFPLAAELMARGARVSYHDPGVPRVRVAGQELRARPNLSAALAESDIAILLQDHHCYESADLHRSNCLLLDTRGVASGHGVTLL